VVRDICSQNPTSVCRVIISGADGGATIKKNNIKAGSGSASGLTRYSVRLPHQEKQSVPRKCQKTVSITTAYLVGSDPCDSV
jgi:hypothetical protein